MPSGPANQPALTPARSWWAIVMFMGTLMFSYLDRQLLTLLITPIKQDLGLSDTQISLLIGFAFVVFYVLIGIPMAGLIDRGPRKWVVGGAVAFWSLMTAGCGLARNFVELALARMMLGIGESCNTPGTMSMASDMFSRDKLAKPLSVMAMGVSAGGGVALLVGGWLVLRLTEIGPQTFPIVGTLKPWQMTFMLVSIPGILWALLLVATVPEPPRREEAGAVPPGFAGTIGYLWRNRGIYWPMFMANAIKAMLSFGVAAWAPVFFERKFGMAPGEPGPVLGMMSLTLSPLAMLLGGWIAERMAAAGYKDANMRMVFLVTIPLIPISIAYPMVPEQWMAFSLAGLAVIFGSIGAGPANAAIQSVTPGRMRGTTTAIYVSMYNLIGYGLGPLIIGLLNDNLFGESGIARSMLVLALVIGPVGLLFSWVALKPYAKAVEAAEARGE